MFPVFPGDEAISPGPFRPDRLALDTPASFGINENNFHSAPSAFFPVSGDVTKT
jgi:hypothetical protein